MKEKRPKGQQKSDFNNHEDQAAGSEGEKEIAAAHGCTDETLQEFALPHVDEGKADAPHTGVHQVHAEQAGNQEIDITGARFGRGHDRSSDRVVAARGGLNGFIDFGPGQHALRPRGIVAVSKSSVGAGSMMRSNLPKRNPWRASFVSSTLTLKNRAAGSAPAGSGQTV